MKTVNNCSKYYQHVIIRDTCTCTSPLTCKHVLLHVATCNSMRERYEYNKLTLAAQSDSSLLPCIEGGVHSCSSPYPPTAYL